ncbi:hypothetical protein LJC58_02430 [Lachnospiraceae bacterium OttesenSCG-928-D06]|nr:hypothetical protein [Lachnospiraceae bacterium OttesenSCG-928-D06]
MEKLFYKDVHITEFNGTVTSCTKEEKGFFITLDQTAFFPEEGGQIADKGSIADFPVKDVIIKDDIIYHLLDTPLTVGSVVKGCVDFAQRFDFMQQHTGEHIISGLVHEEYQYDNVGFHLDNHIVTLDFNGVLNLDQLRSIENKANEIIWAQIPVNAWFPDPKLLSTMPYRSKKAIPGDIRIVEIPGVDICACCAPHVDNTAEIGIIKITDVMNHRGGVRVTIVCGGRALKDYTKKQDNATAISVLLSSKTDEIPTAVNRLFSEKQLLKEQNNALQANLLSLKIAQVNGPVKGANPCLFVEDMDGIAIRNGVNELCKKYEDYCGIFSGNDTNGYRFVIGSAKRDCKKLLEKLKEHNAKGGGSSLMIQGTISAPEEEITVFFSSNIFQEE